nr:CoA transferase [Nocardioides convexus]
MPGERSDHAIEQTPRRPRHHDLRRHHRGADQRDRRADAGTAARRRAPADRAGRLMPGPLEGLKVVQVASLAPAPFGCMVLADLGAEVIRVERSGGGDALAVPSGYLDRGQRSIAVDLKSPEGAEVLLALVEDADVLVEGFRPGVMERLGVGPDECLRRNPGLVYARLTGYGQDGPMAAAAGHDINYIAMSGALEPVGRAGERPYAPLNTVADFAGGGFLLVIGVLAALQERQRSQEGQVVDVSMVDGSALLTTFLHGMESAGLWTHERGTNFFDGGAAFYDTYACADARYVAVGAVEPQFYALLLDRLGLADADLPHPFDTDRAEEPACRARGALPGADPGGVDGGLRRRRRLRDAGALAVGGARAPAPPRASYLRGGRGPGPARPGPSVQPDSRRRALARSGQGSAPTPTTCSPGSAATPPPSPTCGPAASSGEPHDDVLVLGPGSGGR